MLGLTTFKGCQKIPVFPSHSLSVWLLHGLCTLASFNWGSATLPGAWFNKECNLSGSPGTLVPLDLDIRALTAEPLIYLYLFW